MTQFRKKPVVIEATQWFKNGDHPLDYAEDQQGLEGGELRIFTGAERKVSGWEGEVVRYYRHPDVPGDKPCEQCGKPHHIHGWIDTLEQGHRVCPGDWIITGVEGERYPCKPSIFEASYEAPAAPADAMPDGPVRVATLWVDPALSEGAVATVDGGEVTRRLVAGAYPLFLRASPATASPATEPRREYPYFVIPAPK